MKWVIVLVLFLVLFISGCEGVQESPNLEKEKIFEGYLDIIAIDDFENPRYIHYLNIDGEKYEISSEQHLPIMLSGTRVSLKGIIFEGKILVTGSSFTVLAQPIEDNLERNFGAQNTLVILTKCSGDSEPFTQSEITSLVFEGMDDFIRENSLNQTWIIGNTTSWITLSDETCSDPSNLKFDAAIEAADPLVDFSDYNAVMAFIGSYAPSASVGSTLIETDDGEIIAKKLRFPVRGPYNFTYYAPIAILAHEFGHGFGFGHADGLTCGEPLGEVVIDNCLRRPSYGDPFDTMGGAFNSINSSPHYSSFFKYDAGWINSPIVLSPPRGNFQMLPSETNGGDNSLFLLSYFGGTDYYDYYYTFEYRYPIGFDDIDDPSWPEVEQGIYIRATFPNTHNIAHHMNTGLIDSHPETETLNDSVLLIGESYVDSILGFKLTLLNASSEEAWILFESSPIIKSNLIYDSSFETDDGIDYYPEWNLDDEIRRNDLPDGWKYWNGGQAEGIMDHSEFLSGDFSFKIETPEILENDRNALYQDVPVVYKNKYKVSGYVKTNCLDENCYGTILTSCIDENHNQIYGCGFNTPENQIERIFGNSDWTKIEYTLEGDNIDADYIRVYCYHTPWNEAYPNPGAGTVWCDDFKVEEISKPLEEEPDIATTRQPLQPKEIQEELDKKTKELPKSKQKLSPLQSFWDKLLEILF